MCRINTVNKNVYRVEELTRPLTVKGSKSSRDRRNADLTVPDDIAPSDAEEFVDVKYVFRLHLCAVLKPFLKQRIQS